MATNQLPTHLIDIQSAEFAEQYERGVNWSIYGDEQGKGPVPASYLVTNLKLYAERGYFERYDPMSLYHIGFLLGMYHGGVLEPSTGQLRLNVTTLPTSTTGTPGEATAQAGRSSLSMRNRTSAG